MGGNLPVGKILKSENGIDYEVIKLIGSGGQGEVYEVKAGGERYALKWYLPHIATKDQQKILKNLILKGSPDDIFLWPKDLVQEGGLFGYIMDLRPSGYSSLFDLMKRSEEPTPNVLCLSGFNIAKGFQKLHSEGWCYRDISFGNVFIDFESGNVLICDNDNAVPNRSTIGNIGGTLGFMAPEIVNGIAKPSTNTDLFSLSILLFYLFNIHHPLEGKLEADIKSWDIYAKNKIYGEKPIFIWDPNDRSNRPVAGYQQNAIDFWNMYPKFFKELFILAFTDGLTKPQKRSTESVWQHGCIRLLNSIVYCQEKNCGAENFFDNDKVELGVGQTCWSCQKLIPSPAILKINSDLIVLNRTTKIRQHHARGDFCLDNIIGEVNQKPDDPTQWGIKNLTNEVWTFTRPDCQVILVGNGKSFPLLKGSRINFGNNFGEII